MNTHIFYTYIILIHPLMHNATPFKITSQSGPSGIKQPAGEGFSSPDSGHPENLSDLQRYVVRHPASTFLVRVGEGGHPELGLHSGDLLVVDRSLAPRHNSLVIAELKGEHKICRLSVKNRNWLLKDGLGGIYEITFSDPFQTPVWGRVSHVIHPV